MLLLHLSDLHLSRYGEHRKWTALDEEDEAWTALHAWKRWRVEGKRDKKDRPERLRLVDPEGIVHARRKWPAERKEEKAIGALIELAMKRHMTSAEVLAADRPPPDDLESLLRVDPTNTNLRFLQLLDHVLPLGPELIVVTGDITDNGFGYGLVKHYLAPWIDSRRLLVVPGNHDTYDMLPRRGRRGRMKVMDERYRAFATDIGCAPNDDGAYMLRVDDLAVVGLSSCKPPRTPLSASGAVSREQLAWLADAAGRPEWTGARSRLCLLHHHLLRMPFELGKRSPIEMGLRLRNAQEVMQACSEAKIDMIFHGHRHHGYMVKLPGHPTVVSSPSSTRGCKSTDMRYVWTVDLAEANPSPQVHRFTEERAFDPESLVEEEL